MSRPTDEAELVLGHELLGVVEARRRAASRAATSSPRPSGARARHCLACEEGSPDSCLTGDYSERGITRLDGFARELVAEDAAQLIPIPPSLGRLGVLAEPTSICARAIRHALRDRRPRSRGSSSVRSCSAPARSGLLSTYLLRLAGIDVWTASLEPRTRSRRRPAARATSRKTSRSTRCARSSAASTS